MTSSLKQALLSEHNINNMILDTLDNALSHRHDNVLYTNIQ